MSPSGASQATLPSIRNCAFFCHAASSSFSSRFSISAAFFSKAATESWTVVGPICESGDELGRDRLLPRCEEGDVLLFADAGAYGHAMSSNYNLREPAPELLVPN